jgi:hypothetical protein
MNLKSLFGGDPSAGALWGIQSDKNISRASYSAKPDYYATLLNLGMVQ